MSWGWANEVAKVKCLLGWQKTSAIPVPHLQRDKLTCPHPRDTSSFKTDIVFRNFTQNLFYSNTVPMKITQPFQKYLVYSLVVVLFEIEQKALRNVKSRDRCI